MIGNTVVRARVDETVKAGATEVLATMGLTISDAVRILLTKVARDKALPFDLTPNALTDATLRASARGDDVHAAADAAALFRDLEI